VRKNAAGSAPDPFAVRVLGLLGEKKDGDRLLALASDAALAPAALAALRDLAQPRLGPALVPLLAAKDEAVAEASRDAFESLLGPVPDPDPAHPLPDGVSAEEAHANRVVASLEKGERRLRGVAFPWAGEEADRPLEFLWRAAIAEPGRERAWLRHEVPDGFFAGAADVEVLPGL
jgi:hypothetical protein